MMGGRDEIDSSRRPALRHSPVRAALVAGAIAGLAVLMTLDGPGLTIDEPLDVRPGRTYLALLRRHGTGFLSREVVDRAFRDNAEHPPMGRWLLGIASTLGEPFQALLLGPDPTGIYVIAGRLAPALAFACLCALGAAEATRRWGAAAGLGAAWALLIMPRVFAHAHLAALETFLSLFWTLALLSAARAVDSPRPVLRMALVGAFWSLALLTKIHAWLLPILVTPWAFARLKPARAVAALASWAAVGVTGFFLGWPWLWYDTAARWAGYLGTSVNRATIMVRYFGRDFADRDVPWHFPWFYFAVSVPVGLHLLGFAGLGLACRRRTPEPFALLLAGSIALFLALFSTGVPVYDGERLFLHVFPAWALLVGLGFSHLLRLAAALPMGRRLLAVALVAQGYGVVSMHPFGLSYYNLLTGGLAGAERLRLELTYWGDAVDRPLLDRLAREAAKGSSAALAPTLYPGQGIATTTAPLARKDVIVGDEDRAVRSEWLLVSRREAYWKPDLLARMRTPGSVRIATRARQGVWLAALWHIPPARPTGPSPLPPPPRTPGRETSTVP